MHTTKSNTHLLITQTNRSRKMDKHQELEWAEAQKITVNVNLVAAAKRQLRFLAAVDRNRSLYEGPAPLHAIYRYKFCWLPLLAKQAEVAIFPLVAPLDCEWVWHCHRLNPLRYKADCEELYGRVLDTLNVVSSVEGASIKQTEEIWNNLYPNEPYLVDLNSCFDHGDGAIAAKFGDSKTTSYDLVSFIKRQSDFFYQVSRPHMINDDYLEGSVARYKGFLHLIRKKMTSTDSTKSFSVPTYDIDLIWHSHQLHPAAYCQDTMAIFGKVLEHDNTDSERGEGTRLIVGFTETTKQWVESYGLSYMRAGARYRCRAPTPLMVDSFPSGDAVKKMSNGYQNMVDLPKEFLVEVLMEIVGVKITPEKPDENLFICLSNKNEATKPMRIPFDTQEKRVVAFQCDPKEVLIFELVSELPNSKATEVLGTASLSLPQGRLYEDRVLELMPASGIASETPMVLRVSLSLTPPVAAPYVLVVAPLMTASESYRILMPQKKLELMDGSWTCVMDRTGNLVVGIQIKGNTKKEVIGISVSGEMRILAESEGDEWSLIDSEWSLRPSEKTSNHGYLYELTGERKVLMIPGRKLEYETETFGIQGDDQGFMTAVEFSSEDPNGKAIALFDMNSDALEIKEEWFLLPGMVSACVLSTTMEDNKVDLDKGNGFSTQKACRQSSVLGLHGLHGKEFMANCMSGGCGGGACGGGCGGGACRGVVCHSSCGH